jgi:DNA-directed RNA polymerase specialized sigma24 family protein
MSQPLSSAEVLEYAREAVFYHLKSRATHVIYERYGNASAEDLTMDALERILASEVYPQTKTFIRQAVLFTCLDALKRKPHIPSAANLPKLQENGERMEDLPQETVEMFDINEISQNIKGILTLLELDLYMLLLAGHGPRAIAEIEDITERHARRLINELQNKIENHLNG